MVSFRRNRADRSAAADAGDTAPDAAAPAPANQPREQSANVPPPTAPIRQPPREEPEHTQRLDRPVQERPVTTPPVQERPVREQPLAGGSALDDPAYERFGGANLGAAFFGWMVAVGMTVLLTGLLGAVVLVLGVSTPLTDLGSSIDLTTASIVSAAVALVVLLVAYYSGGYVAGRMSRFDGGRQGFAVWLLALLFTALGAVAGWVAGDRYDVLSGADLPSVALSGQETTVAGVVSLVVVLLGTLLAAVGGGKVGRRYHRKVDRAL